RPCDAHDRLGAPDVERSSGRRLGAALRRHARPRTEQGLDRRDEQRDPRSRRLRRRGVVVLDHDELAARATDAAHEWAPGCTITDVEPLTGGWSSLTFTARVDGGPVPAECIVLKVAPPGVEPVRNRDVARQARPLRALAAAD